MTEEQARYPFYVAENKRQRPREDSRVVFVFGTMTFGTGIARSEGPRPADFPENIGVSKRAALRAYIEEKQPAVIGEGEWADLCVRLAPIGEGYLRRLVRGAGLPMAPLVEGVRQESFDELERTLKALANEYLDAMEAGEKVRAKQVRRAVISAKDHARFAAVRLEGEAREAREEMLLWILTWLENPGVFPAWMELRKRTHEEEQTDHAEALRDPEERA